MAGSGRPRMRSSTMPEELVIYECSMHGLDAHVRAHEAGHAVAAIEYGIAFRGLVVYGEGDEPRIGDLTSAAAQIVMLSEDHSSWVRPDPVAALRFALGGIAGEYAVLDDGIPDSAHSDMGAWRAGYSESKEALDDAKVEIALGTPLIEIYKETLDWASANVADIRKLAEHLETLPPSTQLSYDAIVALLRDEGTR